MPTDDLLLTGAPTDVPYGRRFVRDRLAGWTVGDGLDEAELVTAELVTNALLHAGPPVRLTVSASGRTIRLEVRDVSGVAPVRPASPADDLTGRGLALVDAVAERWGVDVGADGKAVWAELRTETLVPPAGGGRAGPGTGGQSPPADRTGDGTRDGAPSRPAPRAEPRYPVRLADVPTDLLLEAKRHVDSLVREFSLLTSGGAAGISAPVPPPLAELVQTVTTEFAEARHEIGRQAAAAAETGAERLTLSLSLPASAAAAGERYLAALDAADGYARSSRLLTLEEPPRQRAFRHWYVNRLLAELRAATGEPATPPRSLEQFLLGEVDRLAGLQRSSEHSARLQRATAVLAGATTAGQVGAAVLKEAVEAFAALRGALVLPDPPEQGPGDRPAATRVAARHGAPLPVPPRRDPPTESPDAMSPGLAALRSGIPIWIETAAERDAQFPAMRVTEPDSVAVCVLPLRSGAATIGALRLSFGAPRLFDYDERRFLTALAATAAQALERARLFDSQRTLADRLSRLQAVSAALVAARTPDQVAEVIVSHASGALGSSLETVCLLTDDGTELEIVRSGGRFDRHRWARFPVDAQLPASEAVRTNAPVMVTSAQERDRRFPGLAGVPPAADHALICLPLSVGDRRLGVLTLSFPAERTVDADELRFLMALAAECAQSLDRANALIEAQSAGEKLAFLAEASAELAGSLDYETTLAAVTRLAVPRLADWATVSVADDARGIRTLAIAHVDPAKVAFAEEIESRYPPDPDAPRGVPHVVRTGISELVPEVTDEMLVAGAQDEHHLEIARALGLSSAMVVPLASRGRVFGAMQFLLARPGQRYTAEDLALAEDLANRAAVAMENAKNYQASASASLALQRSLLPTRLPDVPGLDLAWQYRPGTAGTEVGGDWFDAIPLPGERAALVIGDVMGRGVRAAAVMGQLRAATRAYAALDLPPETVLGLLDQLVQSLEETQIVTAIYAVYDAHNRRLTLANAGHVPPVLATPVGNPSPAGAEPLPGSAVALDIITGVPLGVGGVPFTARTIGLAPDSVLALYTDGLAETRRRDVGRGIEELIELMRHPGRDLEALTRTIVEELSPASGSDDDVALFLARTRAEPGAPADPRQAEARAVPTGVPRPSSPRSSERLLR